MQGQEVASFKPSDIVAFVVCTDARAKEKRAAGVTLVKVCAPCLLLDKHLYTLSKPRIYFITALGNLDTPHTAHATIKNAFSRLQWYGACVYNFAASC